MRKHILVVDPEAHVLELLALYLNENGFRVSLAGTPKDALLILNSEQVDLVTTEIALGTEDGLILLSTIKGSLPTIPVIVLTGLGYVEDLMQEAVEKGAAGYVSKILPLDELLLVIHRALRTDQFAARRTE